MQNYFHFLSISGCLLLSALVPKSGFSLSLLLRARPGRPLAPTFLEGEVVSHLRRGRERGVCFISAQRLLGRGVVSGSEAGPVRLSFVMHDSWIRLSACCPGRCPGVRAEGGCWGGGGENLYWRECAFGNFDRRPAPSRVDLPFVRRLWLTILILRLSFQ